MAWRVANSLDVLLAEINAAAPDRSKASDGSIGDPAHSSRESDHNPNAAGVVRARDFTHDPNGGLDCKALAAALVDLLWTGEHPALRSGAYVIWDHRIFSVDRRGEGWRPYSGSNPHDHHLHLSVATAASGYDATAPWGVMEEEDVVKPEDIEAIAKRTAELILDAEKVDKDGKVSVRQSLNQTRNDAAKAAAK